MSTKARNVLFTLCGVAGLALKGRYHGPYQAVVRGYCGNIALALLADAAASRIIRRLKPNGESA